MEERDDTKDAASLQTLQDMLQKYAFSDAEKDAVRTAIGLLAWTKLVEGYKNRKKRARERLLDTDIQTF